MLMMGPQLGFFSVASLADVAGNSSSKYPALY